ncbi:hypothetical protein [Rhizobium sp. 9140]|uniref:hypothetical protein n=1 Tax=Rhizobium sp. 9140 TaxID=1761900 RepID=UPI000795B0D1|nr:hypothetical protein [Rhizobium sp. 9140]CZT32999.1 hypothetical protein GA0004734_00000270 [Rhizobium sp. 9140]
MPPKNLKTGTALTTAPAAVILPAATGDGVSREASAADALRLGENVNNDAPGDLAADLVTRPIVAAAPVVEPANAGLGEHPALDGDQAGDAAIAHVAAGTPSIVDGTILAENITAGAVTATSSRLFDPKTDDFDTDRAAVGADDGATDFVVFDLSRPATEEERANLQLVLDHIQAQFPDFTLPGDARPVFAEPEPIVDYSVGGVDFAYGEKAEPVDMEGLELSLSFGVRRVSVTSKVPGFRRGGRAHPTEKVTYPVEAFTREQLLSVLNEPMLIAELD